ncbi:preprotein translocase subunit YajC [bacterium]|nr:preprotein translocase subunit YajC [bacterium]
MTGMQAGSGGGGGALVAWMPFILAFGVLYFLLIRPQQQKQKQLQAMLASLKKGDKVITSSGIIGTIIGFKEKSDVIIVKIADDVKVEMQRGAVVGVIVEKE